MKKMKRWASVLLILCMLLAGTPAPAESSGAFTATPTAEQSAEPTNTVTAEPTNTATAEPENTATAEPTNTATAEPTDTPSPIPTDATEVKTIVSFEAVAPEDFVRRKERLKQTLVCLCFSTSSSQTARRVKWR